MTAGGKGSVPRPKSVDAETFANNWEAIFGKKNKKVEKPIDRDVDKAYNDERLVTKHDKE